MEKLIKSTAVVLGFLFALSTAYYLTFWSYFNIDVFQYIAVEDIIKGVAYPLRFAGIEILVLFAFVAFLMAISYFSDEHADNQVRSVIIGFFLATLFVLILFAFISTTRLVGMVLSLVLSLLLLLSNVAIGNVHKSNQQEAARKRAAFDDEDPVAKVFRFTVAYCIVFFPVNAVIAGVVEAKAINAGMRYEYIMAYDLPKEKVIISQPYLIFLGAVSEKYIFIDRQMDERFIIDKDELPDLRLHHFDASDKLSVRKMSTCMQRKFARPRK